MAPEIKAATSSKQLVAEKGRSQQVNPQVNLVMKRRTRFNPASRVMTKLQPARPTYSFLFFPELSKQTGV
jgi:hypothetical protein